MTKEEIVKRTICDSCGHNAGVYTTHLVFCFSSDRDFSELSKRRFDLCWDCRSRVISLMERIEREIKHRGELT